MTKVLCLLNDYEISNLNYYVKKRKKKERKRKRKKRHYYYRKTTDEDLCAIDSQIDSFLMKKERH